MDKLRDLRRHSLGSMKDLMDGPHCMLFLLTFFYQLIDDSIFVYKFKRSVSRIEKIV